MNLFTITYILIRFKGVGCVCGATSWLHHTNSSHCTFKGCLHTLIVIREQRSPIGYHPKLLKVKSIWAFRAEVLVHSYLSWKFTCLFRAGMF